MNKFVLRQSLLLFLTAVIWGVAFVAQSVGMDYVGPFTFLASRNVIGAIVLLPVICFLGNKKGEQDDAENAVEKKKTSSKTLIIGGICCGIFLFIASILQQYGIKYTTVGKAGFITSMYMVLVPIFGIFLHKKTGLRVWIAVALAAAGLYLLCITKGDVGLQKGDLLVLACAVGFAFHILTVDYFSPLVDGVKMSCIQFAVGAVLGILFALLFEKPDWGSILAAWKPILYAGAMSSGVGYTLQIVGQKGLNPTVASLIMSLESVVSVLAGWLLLGQTLSSREILGCVLAFAAIVLVQLPERGKRKATF